MCNIAYDVVFNKVAPCMVAFSDSNDDEGLGKVVRVEYYTLCKAAVKISC